MRTFIIAALHPYLPAQNVPDVALYGRVEVLHGAAGLWLR